jgi:hypothetical protein
MPEVGPSAEVRIDKHAAGIPDRSNKLASIRRLGTSWSSPEPCISLCQCRYGAWPRSRRRPFGVISRTVVPMQPSDRPSARVLFDLSGNAAVLLMGTPAPIGEAAHSWRLTPIGEMAPDAHRRDGANRAAAHSWRLTPIGEMAPDAHRRGGASAHRRGPATSARADGRGSDRLGQSARQARGVH